MRRSPVSRVFVSPSSSLRLCLPLGLSVSDTAGQGKGDELFLAAAVTVPSLRSKAGASREIFSTVVSPRKPLSATIGFFFEGRKAGSIWVSRPTSWYV